MSKKNKKTIIYLLVITSFLAISHKESLGKMSVGKFTELSIESNPDIGGVAILKLTVTAPIDFSLEKTKIGCFLPEGIELVKEDSHLVISSGPIISPERGESIIFYAGPVKRGERKEFVFRIYIPDGRKYLIGGGCGLGMGDSLELDLGDPEPPEWSSENKERSAPRDGKEYVLLRNIKQIEEEGRVDNLEIPEDSLPPLRTELRIRTKDKPYITPPYNPQEIPLRYLVYTEGEAKNAEVTLELSEGLKLINGQNYEVITQENKSTLVKLFQGPMRFRECKAFYLKVRSGREELFRVKAQIKLATPEGKELLSEDYQDIELGRVLY